MHLFIHLFPTPSLLFVRCQQAEAQIPANLKADQQQALTTTTKKAMETLTNTIRLVWPKRGKKGQNLFFKKIVLRIHSASLIANNRN